ncbi:QueT transporter family protein [Clostridium sp.]|uniref:QueT transporter family protein n=1 Tax=Clostridium sp. TaxID=1506 RepID=UPI002623FE97|nr:QueT transporter family protein [Clostridium sp.]
MNLTEKIVKTGLIAAIYAVTTIAIAPLGYGPIQFRISEVFVLLSFINPFYTTGLTLGCLIANIFGGVGILDMVFGTLATFISCKGIELTRKLIKEDNISLIVSSLWPVVINGIIIGAMLSYIENIPFYIPALQVSLSELIIVTIIGIPVFKLLTKRISWLNIA